jgi:hypothetical protein
MTPTDVSTQTQPEKATRNRRRWFWVVIVPILAVAWWLGSPLFLDDEVNEAFPVASTTAVDADVADTPADVSTELEGSGQDAAEAATAPTSIEPVALTAGSFEGFDAVHQGAGSATVYDVGGSTVIRFEDFEVTNGPDLRVNLVLSDGSMIDVGALKGNVGDQNYDIPADVDLGSVERVLVYCRAFSVPFAEAVLG